MKITLVQIGIVWRDVVVNLRRSEQLMRSCEPSDLYVLPEMFATGFDVKPDKSLDDSAVQVQEWMLRMAEELDAAVCGSVAVRHEGHYYNRCYFVKPDRTLVCYDKRHLFSYGGENLTYTAGKAQCVVEWRGVRFMLQVCYDLRFPCLSRNVVRTERMSDVGFDALYDCCIYVANWPESRRRVWDTLLQARAIENQCYVLAVNRVGDDPQCHYNGGTVVVDAYGRKVAAVTDDSEGVLTCELDMEKLRAFRKKFPVLQDAD